MSQYTDSKTSAGFVVNAVFNTEASQIVYTVTAPNGAVATVTTDSDGAGNSDASNLIDQLISGGALQGTDTNADRPARNAISNSLRSVTRNVIIQNRDATATAVATGNPPPAERQAIPVSTASDPATPAPAPAPETTTPSVTVPTPVAPLTDEEQALAAAGDAGAGPGEISYRPTPVAPLTDEEQALAAAGDAGAGPGETSYSPAPVDDTVYYENNGTSSVSTGQLPSETDISNRNATVAKLNANQQATLQSRYKQPGNTDWRVRLQLAPNSDYLYTASDAGILAPLAASNGLIFPYTPQITTSYAANYEMYDLVHSNYRGLFYKNSKVGDVQVRATFTAQDSAEANYLLAVIHFFRSVTKMFYGQDAQRGTPPPLVYLSGFGNFQFSQHPCVVSQFNYTLPNDVDYIRATNPNNYGINLLNRRTPTKSAPGGVNFAGALRLANALLPKGGKAAPAAQTSTPASVNNTDQSTYVPTKMEIDITLIPVQSRSQVSKQFSLKEFANGNLIKKGFW